MFDTSNSGDTASHTKEGRALVESYRAMTRRKAAWLEELGQFDADREWAALGQTSCAEWLMARADLPRTTAYESVRIAGQLRRRPIVAEAFQDGSIGYCAVRALTRMEAPGSDVDQELVNLAGTRPVAELERIVRSYAKRPRRGPGFSSGGGGGRTPRSRRA